jgi:hypothetical protein
VVATIKTINEYKKSGIAALFVRYEYENEEVALSPIYDLLSTQLAMPEDLEETALTINGKKNRLRRADFDELAEKLGLASKSADRVYRKFEKKNGFDSVDWEKLFVRSSKDTLYRVTT